MNLAESNRQIVLNGLVAPFRLEPNHCGLLVIKRVAQKNRCHNTSVTCEGI